MSVTRRDFLKLSGGAAASLLGGAGSVSCSRRDSVPLGTPSASFLCLSCSLGCGLVRYSHNGSVQGVRGDQESPVNRGRLCSYGIAQIQKHDQKPGMVRYRAPGASVWRQLPWQDAYNMIARRIKDLRDETLVTLKDGARYNRTDALVMSAGTSLTGEEAYAAGKFMDSTGAAVRMPSGGDYRWKDTLDLFQRRLGFGAAPSTISDVEEADIIIDMYSGICETHPVAAGTLTAAMKKGATVVSVGQRLDGAALLSSQRIVLPRSLQPGLIRNCIASLLESGSVKKEFLRDYTNAPLIAAYGEDTLPDLKGYILNAKGIPRRDGAFKHEQSVYRHLTRYYQAARQTQENLPGETELISLIKKGMQDNRRVVFILPAGETVLAGEVLTLQMLTGNVGEKGRGIILSGIPVGGQHWYDHGLHGTFLPGGLATPVPGKDDTFYDYVKNHRPAGNDPRSINIYSELDALVSSFLKSRYDGISDENDRGYGFIPRRGSGELGAPRGAVIIADNPAAGSADMKEFLQTLEWLVVIDTNEGATSSFWNEVPRNTTEVFFLPLKDMAERRGSFTSPDRLVQFHAPLEERDGSRQDALTIMEEVMVSLKRLYRAEGGALPDQILKARWDYKGDCIAVADEISGTGEFSTLRKGAEKFMAGNWLYHGYAGGFEADQPWRWPRNIPLLHYRAAYSQEGRTWSGSEDRRIRRRDKWVIPVYDSREPSEQHPFILLPEGVARFEVKSMDAPPEENRPRLTVIPLPWAEERMKWAQPSSIVRAAPAAADTFGFSGEQEAVWHRPEGSIVIPVIIDDTVYTMDSVDNIILETALIPAGYIEVQISQGPGNDRLRIFI